jgi:hypothetical protein
MTRHRRNLWLFAVVVLWLIGDVFLIVSSAPRSAATVIPADRPVPLDAGQARSHRPSGNLSQPTTAPTSDLARLLLVLGAKVSEFPDGAEYILTGRDVVVSLWVGDSPNAGHPDSLNVQLVLR